MDNKIVITRVELPAGAQKSILRMLGGLLKTDMFSSVLRDRRTSKRRGNEGYLGLEGTISSIPVPRAGDIQKTRDPLSWVKRLYGIQDN